MFTSVQEHHKYDMNLMFLPTIYFVVGLKTFLSEAVEYLAMNCKFIHGSKLLVSVFEFTFNRMDATLGEIATLIKEVHEDARKRNARFSFAFVYPDGRGDCVIRNVGKVDRGFRDDSYRSLHDLRFQIGDFLDCAVIL